MCAALVIRATHFSPTQSNLIPTALILRRMSQPSDIVAHGLREAGYALTNIIGMTNANLRPLTLKQRATGRLKQLEVIVRRLLTLMALVLTLAPVRPRINPAPDPTEAGVETVSFPTPRRFGLTPPYPGWIRAPPTARCLLRPSLPGSVRSMPFWKIPACMQSASHAPLSASANAASRARLCCRWRPPIGCARNSA